MRLMRVFLTILMLTTAPLTESDAGSADTGVSPGDAALSGYFLAIGEHYRLPQREVMIIMERGIPPYEIPVVLFIAKRAHISPDIITDFRLWNNSWLYIALRFGLGPEIFYVPVGVVVRNSFYGKANWYYKNIPKKEWKKIMLSDDDIINLVNLKLMSEHYGYPPEEIIKMRSEGKEFASINDEITKEKGKMKEHGKK